MSIDFDATFTADSSLTVDSGLADAAGESRVSTRLGRITTPYREAERFLAYLAGILTQIDTAAKATERVPDFFDIRNAVGEQLTFIGKRLGFPRCHCVCDATPVFGFKCGDGTSRPGPPLVGFCETGAWRGCGGVSDLCISDDEAYRAHLVARRYQFLGLYDLESLSAALRAVWGPTAWVPRAGRGQVVVAPGRDLTTEEARRFSITLRVLPIAPTMEIAVHYGAKPIAGFGAGWAGFCSGAAWLCPEVVDPYSCDDPPPRAVFGFPRPDAPHPVAGFGDTDATWAACQ